MDLDRAIAVLRAAGETTRLRILAVLSKGELTVTELTQVLGQSQPRISRHLKLMVEAELLERFREGAWVFYRLSEHLPLGLEASRLLGFIPFDDPTIVRDLERLERVQDVRRAEAEAYFSRSAAEWAEIRSLHVAERDVEEAMSKLVGPGPFHTILDLGTGTGRILELFAPLGSHGIGIDLSHDMLALARSKIQDANLTHCQIRQGDLYSLPFDNHDRDVDLILVHQVLHFMSDPAAVISEAARVLSPKGQVVIVDFAPHDLEALRQNHAHRRLGFSEDEVRLWCEAAGLNVNETKHLAPSDDDGEKLTVSLWLATPAPSSKAESQSVDPRMVTK
jgi:ArsR family transcriptional regulator